MCLNKVLFQVSFQPPERLQVTRLKHGRSLRGQLHFGGGKLAMLDGRDVGRVHAYRLSYRR